MESGYGASVWLYVGLGASVGSQYSSICRTGSQFRGCNSTSSLVTRFGALEMKNRVVGSQIRAILRSGSRHRVIYRAESQCRARGRMSSDTVSLLYPLLAPVGHFALFPSGLNTKLLDRGW